MIWKKTSVEHKKVVVNFVKVLEEKLKLMKENEYFTVIYFGKMCQTFERRMVDNDSRQFLDWFPITHQFVVVHLVDGYTEQGNLWNCSGIVATLAMEPLVAATNSAWHLMTHLVEILTLEDALMGMAADGINFMLRIKMDICTQKIKMITLSTFILWASRQLVSI